MQTLEAMRTREAPQEKGEKTKIDHGDITTITPIIAALQRTATTKMVTGISVHATTKTRTETTAGRSDTVVDTDMVRKTRPSHLKRRRDGGLLSETNLHN